MQYVQIILEYKQIYTDTDQNLQICTLHTNIVLLVKTHNAD